MTQILTAANLVKAIDRLPKDRWYDYPTSGTKSQVRVTSADTSEGPIRIVRKNKEGKEKEGTISSEMMWRVANAFSQDKVINFDRVLGASYNTRSALEALLANTPEFYMCRPGRIELVGGSESIKKGHKHLMWRPNQRHKEGVIVWEQTELIISEVALTNVYGSIDISTASNENDMPDVRRRHAQIQIALAVIGHQLSYKVWIARNDRSIKYAGKSLSELDGVLSRISDHTVLSGFPDQARHGELIDAIWFKNARLMPAVFEVEHSTGVTSGLSRMLRFHRAIPALADVRWVIAAPDDDREQVIRECSRQEFADLNPRFMPYSAVEELFRLCQTRKLRGVTEAFLDCFMEPVLEIARQN